MAYKHSVGDLVSVPSAAGKHVPAEIFKIVGDEFFVDYICNHYGRRVFKKGQDVRASKDFDWCAGIELEDLKEGDEVEARYKHGEVRISGSCACTTIPSQPFQIRDSCVVHSNLSYNDGDQEKGVRRQNIRTEQDKGRSRDWTKSCAYKQYTQQQSAAQSLLSYLAPQKKKPTGLSRPKKKNKKEGKRNAEDADNAASSAEEADNASARAAPKAGGKKSTKKAPVIADTYDQVKKMKNKTGYVVGEAVDAKHYKADGDTTDTIKTRVSLRPRKSLKVENYPQNRCLLADTSDSDSERAVGERDEDEEAAAGTGKRKRTASERQRVVPDVAVKKLDKGANAGQAGAFAARSFCAGDIISVYAGMLSFSRDVRQKAGTMLKQECVAMWPPEANHPLINAVLATNYEWGPLKSKELVEVLKKNNCEGEEMVIMPYPNFGNQSMAVNEAEEKNQENCVYITVNYKGFPHVFLLALQDIRRGEQLRTIIPKSNQYFQNRKSCDFRIPGLVRMLSEASGMVPLTEPAVQWEQQLCARASQIYFVMDTKVKKIRDEVEAAWTKAHVSQRANEADVPFEEKVEICNTSKWALDEGRVIEQLRSWLEPKEEAGVRAAPPTTTCDGEQYAEEYQAQTKARKEVQDPCKPKKPASAYFVYLNGAGREQILAQGPALRVQDVAKVAGGIWSHMTPEERLPFEEEAARRLQQYKMDKAAYDQENLGGLGGGGVSAFESEMVEQLKVFCGANPNTWTSTSGKIKKQTLQHIATCPLWERWCGAGFDERKLAHFVHRLRSKYLEDQGVQCNISGESWYSAKDNETPDQISKHSGVSLAALLRVNRHTYPDITRSSKLKRNTILQLPMNTFKSNFSSPPPLPTIASPPPPLDGAKSSEGSTDTSITASISSPAPFP